MTAPAATATERAPTTAFTTRFSALDRIALCPASLAESAGLVDTGSEQSAFGTAGHEVYAAMARGETPDIQQIANRHGIGDLAEKLVRVIDEAGYTPVGDPEVACELRFGDVVVTGTADLVLVKGRVGRVTDYKFSEKRGDTPRVTERVQVPGYALAIAERHDLDVVQAVIFNPFLRAHGFSTLDMDRAEQAKQRATIEAVVTRARDVADLPPSKREYVPSAHCSFCPGRETCPALRKQHVEAAALLPAKKDVAGLPVTPDRFPDLWRVCRQLAEKVKNAQALMRAHLALNGPTSGAGGTLALKSRFMPQSATAKDASAWLRENGHDELAAALDVAMSNRPKLEQPYVSLTGGGHDDAGGNDE